MKKNLLFTSYDLNIGGTETALITLLNELIKKYNITLVLEEKQGVLLNNLDKRITVIEYKPNKNTIVFIRKFINFFKRIKFIIKYKNKFDFSASFATYSKMGSFCSRIASKNNALWVHTDYLALYNNDAAKVKKFFNFVNYNKFKNIICISKASAAKLKHFFALYNMKIINNLIDYTSIIHKSNESIELMKEENKITFINISRHDEMSKKITRIIEAAQLLKKNNYDFKIIFIGDGKDSSMYKNMIHEMQLEKYVVFLGAKENPYPYFKISDCFVLSSAFEGYPVVFNECKVLNLPIITTNVSDAKEDINNKYGVVVDLNTNSLFHAMKNFINNGYMIKNAFNPEEYNNKILNELDLLINGG